MSDDTTTPAGVRDLALALLLRVERGGAHADRLLAGSPVMGLAQRDRSLVRELVLGVLRWKLRLDHTIDLYYTTQSQSLQVEVRMALRLGVFQLLMLDGIPPWAAVHETVAALIRLEGRTASGLVNAILRRVTREGEPPIATDDQVEWIAIRESYPVWLAARWVTAFGNQGAREIMVAGNTRHPVFLRANTMKTDVAGLVERLAEAGYSSAPVTGMPGYVTVSEAEGLFSSALFREGWCTPQDPAAGMASIMLAPAPGETVLDLCAAPGGKTTHCAELAGDRASITAVDLHAGRLGLVKQAAERLGLSSITCAEGDATRFREGEQAVYDRVLCDVPCSGTGVFAKRPDMKWQRTSDDIPRLAELQWAMLERSAALVKPGGCVVYSTCSLEHEENEDQIVRALAELSLVLDADDRFSTFDTGAGYRILPPAMDGTGAFAARLRRLA